MQRLHPTFFSEQLRRPRRLRRTAALRELVAEHVLHPRDLVMPLFAVSGTGRRDAIPSIPGHFYYSTDRIVQECQELYQLGIRAVALFPVIEADLKDEQGSIAYHREASYPSCIATIKQALPELLLIGDVALDPYNSLGHDGVLGASGDVENDATCRYLAKLALCLAESGVDMLAPSRYDGQPYCLPEASLGSACLYATRANLLCG